jgi:hypothetical protein
MTDLPVFMSARGARLAKSCAREFERHLEGLFEHPRIVPGTKALAEVPIVGGVYIVGDERHAMPCFLPLICAALVARERFKQEWPDWPDLPLNWEHCVKMQHNECRRVALMAHYGFSLASADYDYDGHPRFDTYARGLMAYEHCPIEIRNDPELKAEFPPQELAGICDRQTVWRTDEQIAFARNMLARDAALHAR